MADIVTGMPSIAIDRAPFASRATIMDRTFEIDVSATASRHSAGRVVDHVQDAEASAAAGSRNDGADARDRGVRRRTPLHGRLDAWSPPCIACDF